MSETRSSEYLEYLRKELQHFSNADLPEAIELIRGEMAQRRQKAKEALDSMERLFEGADENVIDKHPRQKKIKKARKENKVKLTANDPAKKRAARGSLFALIQNTLQTGGKTRSELEALAKDKNIPHKSIGTLLNRMKKDNKLIHDKQSGLYELTSESRDGQNS